MPKYRPQSEIDQSQKDYKLVLEYFKGDLQKASDYFVGMTGEKMKFIKKKLNRDI